MAIADAAKYLGVFVGPGKKELSWEGPLAKVVRRAKQWAALGLGMFMTIKAYGVYMLSVMMFVGQLTALPCNFQEIEDKICRILFPGPHKWITADVLRNLDAVSFPMGLHCARTASAAARSRVVRTEFLRGGG